LRRAGIRDQVQVVGQLHLGGTADGPPVPGDEGVAQRPQQVADVVLVADHPRTAQHLREHLLDEILGVLTGAAESPSGSIQPIDVIPE